MTGSFVARMLFAVTIMVAALLLAPETSFAHAGHDHGPAASEVARQPSAIKDVADGASEQAGETTPAKSQSAITPSRSKGKVNIACASGCCSAASPSCCAVSTPALLGLLEPPYGHAVFGIVHAKGAGIVPGTLPEPPKSLV
jgi:hypothetical protein